MRAARNRALFLIVWWGIITPAVSLGLFFGYFIHAGHPAPAPHPAPFSCQQVNAQAAPIDAGGQVAPLCGNTPYPTATPEGYGP